MRCLCQDLMPSLCQDPDEAYAKIQMSFAIWMRLNTWKRLGLICWANPSSTLRSQARNSFKKQMSNKQVYLHQTLRAIFIS